ncbi:hypothetical protein MMC30_008701 [Trapelia coarctata]|nr:hypothetical protein [Trapelia coarctata]
MNETSPLLPPVTRPIINEPQDANGPFIEFNSDSDPDNPLGWSKAYKTFIVLLLFYTAFIIAFTCNAVVPVAGHIVQDLDNHERKSASVLLVTIWELGEAAGPLLIAPLSELYGRYPVYGAANGLFIVGVTVAGISQSLETFIFARFLTGLAVASNVLNPAIIGDMFPTESRGSAMSLIMLATLLGGAIGPAIAGAIVQSTSWRHIMWVSVTLAGTAELAFLMLFRETYKVSILKRRAARLRRETGDKTLKTIFDGEDTGSEVWAAIKKPAFVFCGSSVLQIMSIYAAISFSFFYIMVTTLPDMLQEVYDFDTTLIGTSFLSNTVGSTFGVIASNLLLDRIYVHLQRGREKKPKPENRLPLVIFAAFMLPVAVALYGFVAENQLPVMILLVIVGLLGFSLILSIVPVMAYVIDAFGLHSASALTAILITRCLMGTFLPLATVPITDALGYGYGFLILASLSLAVAPIPVVIMLYGKRWRQHSEYSKSN